MKSKYFIFLCLLICLYGFLPVSFGFNKADVSKPNNLLIHRQECGCPCPEASVINGQLIIPEEIQEKYPNIYTTQANLTGRDPFEPYDFEVAQQDILIKGSVVGIDTIACDPSGCEIAPVFKVDSWWISSYYPRFWTHGKVFAVVFLISCLVAAVTIIHFVYYFLKRKLVGV